MYIGDPEKEDKFQAISFGEVMLRLSPTGSERMSQGETFAKRAGGSELNVVSGISLLGLRTGIITKLPYSAIGDFIKNQIRFCGVSDDFLIYDESPKARVGVYYYEGGVFPRRPSVVYDRRHSSISHIRADEVNPQVYTGITRLFHVSGISLALSEECREVVMEMIQKFKKAGAAVSFDVNYRANLWSEEEARTTIQQILPYIDILFVSEETSRRMFAKTGELHTIMKSYCEEYGVKIVCTTERKVTSPTKHTFGSTIYNAQEDRYYTEEPYRDIEVIDRIGSGDAYLAGALFAMLKYGDLQKAVEFGNAMSAVKNTVPGDLPASSYEEIESIIKSHKSSEAQSEMSR